MPHASNTSQQSNSTIASSELLNPDTWSSSVDPVPPPHIFKNENHLLVDNSIYSSAPASPAISGFNFQDEDSDPPSLNRASGTQPWHNRKSRMRDGDVRPASSGVDSHPRSVRDVSKRRTRHFEDQFAYKEGWETNTADEVRRDSPVLLELRTNVIVHDEYALVTELSKQAAKRYQRDESNVMISVFHSTCLMFGGTFEPAYFLTITAIEQHCQTATNKRNAALVQNFLSDVLKVPLHRGLVRFNPIPEDCFATGGRTIAADVEQADADNGIKTASVAHKRKSTRLQSVSAGSSKPPEKPVKEKRKSIMPLGWMRDTEEKAEDKGPQPGKDGKHRSSVASQPKSRADDSLSKSTSRQSAARSEEMFTSTQLSGSTANTVANKSHLSEANTSKRIESPSPHRPPGSKNQALSISSKSFLNHSRPSSSPRSPKLPPSAKDDEYATPAHVAPLNFIPPPIPEDAPTPKVAKRKSFINLFRRDTTKA